MNDKKEDLRIRRTHKLLSDAMVSLLEKKSFDDISVVEICDKAMVHRATFYKHFNDKYEFMEYVAKQALEDFYAHNARDMSSLTPEQCYHFIVSKAMAFVDQYKSIIRISSTSANNSKFLETINTVVCDEIKKLLVATAARRSSDAPDEVIATFLSGGVINIIRWWIVTDSEYSAEDMVGFLERMIFSSRKGEHMTAPLVKE